MEDRYLYKAKRLDNGEWVVGYYAVIGERNVIIEKCVENYYCPDTCESRHGNKIHEVNSKTICQYTGLKDKNGKLIWENDIVDFLGYKGTIVFECGSFGIANKVSIDWRGIGANILPITGCDNRLYACENDNYISLWEIYWNFNDEDDCLSTVEVIGNISDNPDLLESEEIIIYRRKAP